MKKLENCRYLSPNLSDGATKLLFYFDLQEEILKESGTKIANGNDKENNSKKKKLTST